MQRASRRAGRAAGAMTLAIALVACWPTRAEPAGAPAVTEALESLWPVRSAHQFHQALKSGIGFSFEYDGRRVGPETPVGWQVTRQERGETVETSFRHPSGLVAVRRLRTFRDLDAVEYTLHFRNESASELPALPNVHTLDIVFDGEAVEGISVVHSGGGRADSAFPPKDFAVVRTPLGSTAPAKDRLTLSSEGGLPSSVNLPLFFVQNKAQNAGSTGMSQEGIVLIDTPYKEHAYLLTGSIRSVGVDPADITWILHTHYHYDHVGATRRIQELSGAAVGMGAEDIELLKTKSPGYMEPFEVDRPLKHGDTIDLGDTVIHSHHTPGHTPGAMSYTFDVEIDGKRRTAGLFGGPGTNVFTMKDLYYPGAEKQFPRSLDYLSGLDVDVWLGAHPFQNRTLEKHERVQDGEKPNPFIDPEGWLRFLGSIKARYQKIMANPPAWVR